MIFASSPFSYELNLKKIGEGNPNPPPACVVDPRPSWRLGERDKTAREREREREVRKRDDGEVKSERED